MNANASHTHLYLTIPASALDTFDDTRNQLDRLTTQLDIACVTFPLDHTGAGKTTEKDVQLTQLINLLQEKNIAVLCDMTSPLFSVNRKSFEKALEKTLKMNCDGIHMNADNVLYERAREVLDRNAIIGVDCGTSRHLAMQLGENGANYVAFSSTNQAEETSDNISEVLDLVSWWQELFEVPCVAANVLDQSQIDTLLQIPADFIAIGPTLWPAVSHDDELLSWLTKTCPRQTGEA